MSFPDDKGPRFRQHIDTLGQLSERIKDNDEAAVAICIDFVISPVMFCYSGYIRARMANRLKSAQLTETQKHQLRKGLLNLFERDDIGIEYREFVKLLKFIGLEDMQEDYISTLCEGTGKQMFLAQKLGLYKT